MGTEPEGNGGATPTEPGAKQPGPEAPDGDQSREAGAGKPGQPGPAAQKQRAAIQQQQRRAAQATAQMRQLRRRRARKLGILFGVFVALPTVLATVYYLLVVTPQFESVSLVTVNSSEMGASASLQSLMGGMPDIPALRDTLAAREYILSRDMLARLDKEHELIGHYSNPSVDWWSRFSGESFEDAYEYYQDKVIAHFDITTGVMNVTVRAFSAKKAHEIAQAILSYSEERINSLSERARRDRIDFAEGELGKAEKRLVKGREAFLEVQQARGEFSPSAAVTSAMTIRTQLETQVAAARAELQSLEAYMKKDAPKVVAARQKVKSLAAQAAGEKSRLVSKDSARGLSASAAEFEAAATEKEFAQKAYESAMVTLEVARSDAARQHSYLATIAEPSLPDESTLPKAWRGILTVFLACFLVLGVGSLVVAAIKEHARV